MQNKFSFIFILTLLLSAFSVESQNFAYLNASTGNVSEFPVDKDTNIFMFHGNRLEKVDKNLNPVWAKTYTGNSITNVLLSKTGSIYMIVTGASVVKLDASGNVSWIRSISGSTVNISGTVTALGNCTANNLALDRNNNLVITGSYNGFTAASAYFIRMDTNGVINRFRFFNTSIMSTLNSFNIVNDSLGNYKLCAIGISLPGLIGAIMNYSDALDSVTHAGFFAPFTPNSTGTFANFYKSKVNPNNFFLSGVLVDMASNYTIVSGKFNAHKRFWGHQFKWSGGITPNGYNGLSEDQKGNIFVSSSSGPATPYYDSGFLKLDSNGVDNNIQVKYILGYYYGTTYPNQPRDKFNCIYYNSSYFDITGTFFPSNPLTVGKVGPVYATACSATTTITKTIPGTSSVGVYTLATKSVNSYTLVATSAIGSSVSFSTNPNYCLVLNTKQFESENNFEIYPNPTENVIYFKSSLQYKVEEIIVYDVNGRIVISNTNDNLNSLCVSRLDQGIYFLKIKTDSGELKRKFIKN